MQRMHNRWQKLVILSLVPMITTPCIILAENSPETLGDQLDQQQTLANIVEFIHGEIQVAQSFRPTLPELTRIKLYLSKQGDITSDLILTVKDSPTGTTLTQASVAPEHIPAKERAWVEFDFPDIKVNHEDRYYIICNTMSGDLGNYYKWYGSNIDNYEPGTKFVSINNGTTWIQQALSDCAFKTYGAGPILEIIYVVSGFGTDIEVGVQNIGSSSASDINMLATFEGGLLLKDTYRETINTTLEPGGELHILLYPVIGFGFPTLTIRVNAEDVDDVVITKEVALLLFYIYIKP